MDNLVVGTVRALSDDRAVDIVIGIMSGGLIAAGVVGGINIVIIAAAGSAMILISEMRNKLDASVKTKRIDHETARMEIAQVLIQSANDLSDRWLQILQPARI